MLSMIYLLSYLLLNGVSAVQVGLSVNEFKLKRSMVGAELRREDLSLEVTSSLLSFSC